MVKLALLSVSDKRGLVEFAAVLVRTHGYTLLSTGGTAKLLAERGLPVTEVSQHTGFPEIMEGRVKTLHPKIHGGLLCRRDKADHLAQAKANAIELIDLVVVNLYPFEETVAKPNVHFEEAIENIDIGGPSMLRSAAKNHESVSVVCDPADYDAVLAAMAGEGNSARLLELRRKLALKVFQRTASYDAAIARYLELQAVEPDLEAMSGLPPALTLSWKKAQSLRYGENPHQKAALYGTFHDHFAQLQGKELSFNNILDTTSATYLIGEFERPTVAILKHTNPCGVASADTLMSAWEQAYATDRQAPFGGIIIVNQTLDGELAKAIAEIFTEVIIAPRFSDEAMAIFSKKKKPEADDCQGWHRRRRVAGNEVGGRRCAGAGSRSHPRQRKGIQGRDETRTDRRRMGRDALWLESREAREVQLDRLLPRRTDPRCRCRTNGAGGQFAHRGVESGRSGARSARIGRGERGNVSVCGRTGRRGCGRGHGSDSARWFGA